MATFKIKNGVYQNIDEAGLDVGFASLINGYVDESFNVNKRVGYRTWVNIGNNRPVKGLFYWQQKGCIIAVSNGIIYKIDADKNVINKTANALSNKTNPPTFASDGRALWIASGGKMVWLNWASSELNAVYVPDPDAPTSVSHVAYLDGYIIANNVGTDKFHWTNPTDRTSWVSLDWASAEANPDIIIALHVFWRELYLFGQNTIEVWYNRGGNPAFERLGGGLIEVGCSAAYSIVRANNTIYWLDDKRRFVRLSGRQVESVSIPIQKTLDNIPYVADCVAYLVSIRGKNWIILNFESADTTWCYDVDLNVWSQWGEWNTSTKSYNMYRGISSTVIDATTAVSFIENSNEPMTAVNYCGVGLHSWININGVVKNNGGYAQAPYTDIESATRSAGTIIHESCLGFAPWQNPQNAQGDADGINAHVIFEDHQTSYCLYAGNFGFNIPTDAKILAIFVGTRCYVSPGGRAYELRGNLRKPDGTFMDRPVRPYTLDWPQSSLQWISREGYFVLEDPYSLTAAEVNHPNFRFELQLAGRKDTTAYLDAFSVTVYYQRYIKSCHLMATNFGFSVPSNATISGVRCVMDIEKTGYEFQGSVDINAQLIVGGNRVGLNKSYNAIMQTNRQFTYGGYNDLWGLSSLTPAQVNASNFGFNLQVESLGNGIKIHKLVLNVYYSFSTVPFSFGTGVLIGDKSNGLIYEKIDNYYLDDNKTIRLELRTGNITHNTMRNKRCRKLTLRFKGETGDPANLFFNLRWRDNNSKWSNIVTINTGNQLAPRLISNLFRLGVYRTRQYEITHDRATNFMFIEGEEESEVMLT